MDVAEGTVIERYRVLRRLGAGGMATVWLVQHGRIGSLHALKVLDVPSRKIRERLVREGQVQGLVRHPNIVSVSDVLEHQGCPCLLMELVAGPSLEGLLSDQRLSVDQVDSLARGLLAGVGAAHAQGLVHRDLKPANVLLGLEEGGVVPKVADFGLAKVLAGSGEVAATRSGVTMGTPAYMAPEQIRDASRVDARADVFSLGAVLYELLTGARPFDGADTFEIFEAVTQGRRVPLLEREPGTPGRMCGAVEAALRLDPSERPADANALLALWVADTAAPEAPWSESELERMRERGPTLPEVSLANSSLNRSSRGGTTPVPAPSAETFFADGTRPPVPGRSDPTFLAESTRPPVPGRSDPTFLAESTRPPVPEAAATYFPEATQQPPPAVPGLAAASARGRATRGRWLGAVAALGLVAGVAAGAAWWALSRPSESLAGGVVWREGELRAVANGRGALAPGEVGQRVHWRGWSIERVMAENAWGGPPDALATRDDFEAGWTQVWGGGRVVALQRLLPTGLVDLTLRLDPDGDGLIARWLDVLGRPAAPARGGGPTFGQGVEQERWTFDAQGRVAEARWRDAAGQPVADARGTFGVKVRWDEADRLAHLTFLDADGQPGLSSLGASQLRFERDAEGRLTREARLGFNDQLVDGEGGWASRSLRYHADGALAEVTWFNAEGARVPVDGPCATLRYEHADGSSQLACFDPEGAPAVDPSRGHRRELRLNGRGHVVAAHLADAQGAPWVGSEGFASVAWEVDELGQAVREGPYRDAEGRPVIGPAGAWASSNTIDERGAVTERVYLGPEGQPAPGPRGAAIERLRFDDGGRLLHRASFGPDSRPVFDADGVHATRVTWDADGRAFLLAYTDIHGQPTRSREGYAQVRQRVDAGGRPLELRYLDERGEPTLNADGSAIVRYDRDAAGRTVAYEHRDVEGRLVVEREAEYARGERVYDALGREVEHRFFGPDGEPAQVSPFGGSIWLMEYDANSRLARLHLRDAQRRPLPGCTELRSDYDAMGRETREACFDAEGRPVLRDPGLIHARETRYDPQGRIVELGYFGVQGERIAVESGLHRYVSTYEGAFSEPILIRGEGVDGSLEALAGYAVYRATLDPLGRVRAASYFGPDGAPWDGSGGAHVEYVYDDYGRVVSQRRFRADGRGGASDGEAYRSDHRYDPRGNLVESSHWNETGSPALTPYGWHRAVYQFDTYNRQIGWTQYGSDGAPTPGVEGFARKKMRYDAAGRLVSASFFDGADQPVRSNEGYHRFELTLDGAGGELTRALFDVDGLPAAHVEGWHARNQRYDRALRPVEESYQGVDGAPVQGPEGFARRVLRYDASGRVVEERWFDAAGAEVPR